MLAAAPNAKKTARRVAAVGTETGRLDAFPEKRSMIRPIPKGMDRETVEETQSWNRGRRERVNRTCERRKKIGEPISTYETDSDSDRFPFRFSEHHQSFNFPNLDRFLLLVPLTVYIILDRISFSLDS